MIVIHLTGSPPHLDMYDNKPELTKRDGQDCPAEAIAGKKFAFTTGTPKLLGTRRKWTRCGESGIELSDAIPHLHRVADKMCLVRSMFTDQFNHAPAELMVYTGSPRAGRPSLGSWATYGLGTENADLPGFVVLISSGTQPNGGTSSFGSGFLPSVYQGVQCRSKGDPVLYVSDPPGMDRALRRASLDALRDLNELQAKELGNPETVTRIAQYELAFRMQASVPEVMDISREPQEVLDAYGAKPGSPSLANNCLLARRLVENGVRFVTINTFLTVFDEITWDIHGSKPFTSIEGMKNIVCPMYDQAYSALIEDLHQRGLLDDTLVAGLSEFGRTPKVNPAGGRDHYPQCFTVSFAGGGVKGGRAVGASDTIGAFPAERPVKPGDIVATIFHSLGLDHEMHLPGPAGRPFALTDFGTDPIKELFA